MKTAYSTAELVTVTSGQSLSNGAGNTLQGSGGLDLFFGSLGLDNHDKQDGEVFIEV